MLLAQVFLKSGELVHEVDVEESDAVETSHGDLSQETQAIGHETHEEQENRSATQGVHEAKVDRNLTGDCLGVEW